MAFSIVNAKNFESVGGAEGTRKELSKKLLYYMSLVVGLTVIGCFFLIWQKALEPDKAVTIILAVSSVYSGLVGSAMAYYFSSSR